MGKMRFRIHDLTREPPIIYMVDFPWQARSETEATAAREAKRAGEIITMGKILVEPVFESEKKEEGKENGEIQIEGRAGRHSDGDHD